MKKTLSLFIIILLLTSCNNPKNISNNVTNTSNNEVKENNIMDKITVTINDKDYYLHLENNKTTEEFIKLLPSTFNMSELNGNEKYIYLDTTLPTNAQVPTEIIKGDVMLYGNNCLVVFYKSFKTNYSYTKIGHIDNLPDLPDLDNSNINISFKV